MLGWSIFVHAVRMILNNFTDVLKISAVPLLIAIGFGYFLLGDALFMASDFMEFDTVPTEPVHDPDLAALFAKFSLYVIVYMVMLCWVIVNWHRFVLLEEYPSGWLPNLPVSRMLAYAGTAILLTVLAVLFMLPVVLVATMLGMMWNLLAALVFAIGVATLVFLGYRLSVKLPAAAIGRELSLKEAFRATEGSTKTIFGLLLIGFGFALVVQIVIAILSVLPGILGFVPIAFVQVLASMVGVSIITSLYGVYIEGREI